MHILLLLFSAFLNAIGQLFWKYHSLHQTHSTEWITPAFLAGCSMYGISILIWLSVLKKMPVSHAYPILSASFVFVAIGGAVWFHEHLGRTSLIGLACICFGIIIFSYGLK